MINLSMNLVLMENLFNLEFKIDFFYKINNGKSFR